MLVFISPIPALFHKKCQAHSLLPGKREGKKGRCGPARKGLEKKWKKGECSPTWRGQGKVTQLLGCPDSVCMSPIWESPTKTMKRSRSSRFRRRLGSADQACLFPWMPCCHSMLVLCFAVALECILEQRRELGCALSARCKPQCSHEKAHSFWAVRRAPAPLKTPYRKCQRGRAPGQRAHPMRSHCEDDRTTSPDMLACCQCRGL